MDRLEKIASRITASEPLGEAFYHVMDEADKLISVIFFIEDGQKASDYWDWMDYAMNKPKEIKPIANRYGFVYKPRTKDPGAHHHVRGSMYIFVFTGGDDADMEGFKSELAKTFGCQEMD